MLGATPEAKRLGRILGALLALIAVTLFALGIDTTGENIWLGIFVMALSIVALVLAYLCATTGQRPPDGPLGPRGPHGSHRL